MNSVFVEYLRRMQIVAGDEALSEGDLPFITISRETGCHSWNIARMVQQQLNRQAKIKWQLVTKEILADASREMHLNPAQVKGIIAGEKRSHLSEILHSIENHTYLSDSVVRKKLAEFIESAALRGHVIIVGRAGAIITARIPKGLHVRIVAPLDWRINSIMTQQNIGRKEAQQWIIETDEKRRRLLEDFSGRSMNELIFDMVLNNATLGDEEIAGMIAGIIQKR
ncbi:MAG: cytidylate kinase-like family protein [Bacteroidia bacterium]|nr:cytidylate kinase-like family protein [Bacteroidia bacterium]